MRIPVRPRRNPKTHALLNRKFVKHFRSCQLRKYSALAGRDSKVRWGRILQLYIPIVGIGLATATIYQSYFRNKHDGTLNPQVFTSYALISKEPISSTSSLFTLRPTHTKANADIYAEAWRKGVWSVQIKQPQLQIARSYTPLPPLQQENDSNNNDLRVLVRRDPCGEVSGYLHKLPLNAPMELRGPQVEYEIPDELNEVLFLAGGTGIAPALQIVHTLLERRVSPSSNSVPKIQILWANRRREDALDQPVQSIPPGGSWKLWSTKSVQTETEKEDIERRESSSLSSGIQQLKSKHADSVNLQYFVDEHKSFIDEKVLRSYFADNPENESSIEAQTEKGRKVIVVSGPEGFVNYLAGPKIWREGKECQGPLGGLIGKMSIRDWSVQKL